MSFPLTAASESADSIWTKANDAYSKGEYSEAAQAYERILSEAGESAELYYNLGNAYFKQNLIGQARLNYERAHRLDPGDPDIRHNLDFVEAVQTDKIDEVKDLFFTELFNDVGGMLSSSGWTTLFFVLTAFGLLLLYFFVFSKSLRTRKLTFAGFALLVLLGGASFFFGYRQRAGILNRSEAVIYAAEVTVKSTPGDSGADLFIIHEGLKVRVIEKQGNYYRIILNDGKSQGWIPRESAGII
ncbi:MAG: tetratricopeptide repeat protein [Prevotellaceae bacterium]|nr:tetratricopeptide repeat protein [Prevotellaceae bacterium]